MYAGINENDSATPAQRARMEWLTEQLHAIGLAIGQARARGDTAAVASLTAVKTRLNAERTALQNTIIKQGEQVKAAAESGAYDTPLERIAASVRKVAVWGGLGVVALLVVPPLLRRRGS